MMSSQATELAEALNAYTGDDRARDIHILACVDEKATEAAGYCAEELDYPDVEVTCFDGSIVWYTGAEWIPDG